MKRQPNPWSNACLSGGWHGHTTWFVAALGLLLASVGLVSQAGHRPSASQSPSVQAEPHADRWEPLPKVPDCAAGPSPVVLRDGRVLFTTQSFDELVRRSAAIFDPRTHAWTRAGRQGIARARYTLTALQD